MIDILVLNYNDYNTTLEFVKKTCSYESVRTILIVDNNSTDDSFLQLKDVVSSKVELIRTPRNGGYGYGNNYGVRYLIKKYDSEFILLSNPDVIIEEHTLIKLESFLKKNQEYIIAAPYMLDKNGKKTNNTAYKIPTCWQYIFSMGIVYSKYFNKTRYENLEKCNSEFLDVGAVAGSLFLMDAKKMLKYGMYDEKIFLYCEETVLGLKIAKSQYKMALLPQETYIHNHSVSINKTIQSSIKKHKILLKSKLYVIKNHFNANSFQLIMAHIISKISLLEVRILSLIND
ncbi:Glycosyltransferase, GT2 family [Ruminococcus flavefaciens]|uniref:Glycosyltransferase, GT2 family n=1 Tax=Ruminococcus flavefaciens TaxID=1265 RepID=A0A1H6JZL0_RUMFL|nr:glycosyltransferase [Ruminococcus flavefaciens]SEH64592.1 Glycosyltransferase, GT2 family [Ruminococcus flavefaciens]